MTGLLYLAALLGAIAGIALLDRRFRLAFWADRRRTVGTVVIAVVGFLVWDLVGIGLGIFSRGEAPYMTGLLLAPELPVEEAVFLTLLCYNALVAWRWFDRIARRRAAVRADGRGTGRDAGHDLRGGEARP
jgi:lycopene cyclase domain-containing protein